MPYNKKTHKAISIYLKHEIYEEIKKDASENDRAVKYIIEKIVEDYYKRKHKN